MKITLVVVLNISLLFCFVVFVYTGYLSACIHTVALGPWLSWLHTHDCIGCFAIYMNNGYLYYLQYFWRLHLDVFIDYYMLHL